MRTLIFGAGKYGKRLYKYAKANRTDMDIIGFIDSNPQNVNMPKDINVPVMSLKDAEGLDYEQIIISTKSKKHTEEIKQQLSKIKRGGYCAYLRKSRICSMIFT